MGSITNDGLVTSTPSETSNKDEGQKLQSSASDDRGSWSNPIEFFLSCLGFAVGFGNVWRFPYLAYKNGGAVFLIPYTTMLFCAGLPLFFMELCLGQYIALGPTKLFHNMAPLFSGVGLATHMVSFLVSVYFDVIIAWCFFYIYSSFNSVLPWSTCDHDYNSPSCATVEEVHSCQINDTEANQNFYYNKSCLSITEICDVGGYIPLNDTFCLNNITDEILTPAQAINRTSSSEDFYKNGVLGVQDSTFEHMGDLRWPLVACLVLGWVLVAAGLAKGVKSSGKVIYFTALFPYVVLTMLLIVGVTMEGSYEGIKFYFLDVDFNKLLQIEVWTDAASQIFFSLGAAFGSLIMLASYNKFSNNCMRDAIVIATANCMTSVYAGFALFSILGSLAYELGVPISEVVTSGSGLAFIAYPQAVLNLPIPQLWAVLFFLMFVSLGLSSQFAMVETVNTALYDQWPVLRKKKHFVVIGVCSLMLLCGVPMCLQGGVFLFELMNIYSASLSVIFIAIVEVVLVQYIYGHSRFMLNIKKGIGIKIPAFLGIYWTATWVIITPAILALVFVMSCVYWVPAYWGTYLLPPTAQLLGWLMALSSVSMIFIGMVVILIQRKYKGADLIRPTDQFCPAHERSLLQQKANLTDTDPPRTTLNATHEIKEEEKNNASLQSVEIPNVTRF